MGSAAALQEELALEKESRVTATKRARHAESAKQAAELELKLERERRERAEVQLRETEDEMVRVQRAVNAELGRASRKEGRRRTSHSNSPDSEHTP